MNSNNSKNKKILCISVMQNWGGGEEFILRLSKNVNDYELIIASPEGEVLNKFNENRIKTMTVNSLKKIYRNSGWNFNTFSLIIFNIKISTFKLLKIIKTENPSIILANGLFAALYVLPSVIISKRKLIVVQHLIFNENSIEKKIIGLVHKFANNIVCVSNSVKDNLLIMLNKSDSDKIIVIPNGISLTTDKISGKVINNKISVGFIGSIVRLKGIHLIIEALKDIIKTNNIEFHIFGEIANDQDSLQYKSELQNLILNYRLKEKIFFEGFVESKEKIYSSIDIVINYSMIPEAFSFTVLEAMAFKKIIIAADSGGPKEIITNGETGFLVESQKVTLLKEKIVFCVENINSEKFDNIREKAFNELKEKYSIEKFANSYRYLFNSLIQ